MEAVKAVLDGMCSHPDVVSEICRTIVFGDSENHQPAAEFNDHPIKTLDSPTASEKAHAEIGLLKVLPLARWVEYAAKPEVRIRSRSPSSSP